MGYTAPEPTILKMEQDLRLKGYKYKKRKKYYIKRKNRKEYTTVSMRAHSQYVSEFDSQPEMIFTAYKRIK